ncbi:hypothetical protein IVE04_24370 [Pseudomonas mendocina]|jgi:TraL protein|nr:hypothetical protein [Pseudomonas sp. A46]MBF8164304.1 hypothetical protein [Pseudomonas mendocina]
MKKSICSVLLLVLFLAVDAQAATCRAGEAAVRGSQTGYEEDKTAANETSEKELSFSDALEQCVGGISGAQTSPSFGGGGGLSDMLDQLVNRVCRIARERINGELDTDSKRRMAAALQNIYRDYEANQASQPSSTSSSSASAQSGVPSTAVQSPVSTPAIEPSQNDQSAFWQSIWK